VYHTQSVNILNIDEYSLYQSKDDGYCVLLSDAINNQNY